MHGASISRWTMAYFAAALVFLVTALALMGSGFGLPTTAVDAPQTLAVVHLIAIGWLGLLFGGALLQFVPVLAATRLRMPSLAAPALLLLIVGLLCLETGFLALAGDIAVQPTIMSAGAVLLAAGFSLLALPLAATVASQRPLRLPAILVVAGLAALAVTVATGNLFAGLLSGALDIPSLAAQLDGLVPFHAAMGALGWMTVTAVGVSYKLFSMFMLAPERTQRHDAVAALAISALALTSLAMGLAAAGSALARVAAISALLSATMLLALYVRDVWLMFKARRRKVLELNSIAGLTALGFLAIGILLVVPAAVMETDLHLGVAAFHLIGMGWLSGFGLAQLYKIIPFLTWLETYGPVMGKSEVPRVQDLVDEARARLWFGVYYAAVLVGAVSIVIEVALLLQAASCLQCAAVAGLAVEYFRARRLSYAPMHKRLPPGASQPHLIYAITTS